MLNGTDKCGTPVETPPGSVEHVFMFLLRVYNVLGLCKCRLHRTCLFLPHDLFPCAWDAVFPVNLSWFPGIAAFCPVGRGLETFRGLGKEVSWQPSHLLQLRVDIRGRPLWRVTDFARSASWLVAEVKLW